MLNRDEGPRGGLVVWLMAVIVICLAPAMHPSRPTSRCCQSRHMRSEHTAATSGSGLRWEKSHHKHCLFIPLVGVGWTGIGNIGSDNAGHENSEDDGFHYDADNPSDREQGIAVEQELGERHQRGENQCRHAHTCPRVRAIHFYLPQQSIGPHTIPPTMPPIAPTEAPGIPPPAMAPPTAPVTPPPNASCAIQLA